MTDYDEIYDRLNNEGHGFAVCECEAGCACDVNGFEELGDLAQRAETDDGLAVYNDGETITIVGYAHGPWAVAFEARKQDTAGLYAESLSNGWSVVDWRGGRWWPDDEAAAEIAGTDSPAALAVAMCIETPARGAWHD